MEKVTLTLDDKGQVINVEPEHPLKIDGKKLGLECECEGIIDNVTTVTILSKKGRSPCCIITGSGDMWCWC